MNSEEKSEQLKRVLINWQQSMSDFDQVNVRKVMRSTAKSDVELMMCHPFGNLENSDNIYEKIYDPLNAALPDLERRDLIVLAGCTPEGEHWIGCMGNYMGTFLAPFLGIPATGRLAHMRYHEFFRIEEEKISEMHFIWDIPELMMQANAWPMAPSLGREWCVPGPSTMAGISEGDIDLTKSNHSLEHIVSMANAMKRHPSEGGPELMELEKFWHPKMNWYGPSAIGTSRGIEGFRNWHQIPFLNATANLNKKIGNSFVLLSIQ